MRGRLALLLLGALGTGCARGDAADAAASDSALLAAREARLVQSLQDTTQAGSQGPVALWKLPEKLNEISGMVVTPNGRLLAHGDERGKIFEIDYRRGRITGEFTLGSPPVHGDFESITRIGNLLLLFTSDGLLYRFRQGADGASVAYEKYDTDLGSKCEFEGMAYDSTASQLLFACKKTHDKDLKGNVVIFRATVGANGSLEGQSLVPMLIPVDRVIGANKWDDFSPSDITVDPASGNYVLLSSLEKGIVEITPAGDVVFSRPLPPNHPQPEGIAITGDHILIISDEAKGSQARLTLYRWP
ncbi:MAG: hypothetical protein V4503_03415 [Gemmatimonadota bacterium]